MSRGDFLSFLCAVTFALHIVVIGHFSPHHGIRNASGDPGCRRRRCSGLASFWFAEPVRFHLTPGVAAAVLVTGLLATALAFTTHGVGAAVYFGDPGGADLCAGAGGCVVDVVCC